MRKFTWGFLVACILLLAGTAVYRLWSVWAYTQPVTLEELCGYFSLDDCRQIEIHLTRYPSERTYQIITTEDASFGMVMDFFRSHPIRRVLGAKFHPDSTPEEDWSIDFRFYDGAGPIAQEETHHWIKYAGSVGQLSLHKHCADERCFSFSHGMPGLNLVSGASSDFYGPLMEIVETVTDEKGEWLQKKESR